VDKQLGDRIGIPLVTALYEQVITKGGTLSVYSIGALLGAAPLAVMSKLMHGTLPFSVPANTPFPAWPFDARGKPIPARPPQPADGDGAAEQGAGRRVQLPDPVRRLGRQPAPPDRRGRKA